MYTKDGLLGFADAKPSESIHKDELPGLAVAVLFPYMKDIEILNIPVKQYKDYKRSQKGSQARKLSEWLNKKKEAGLTLTGCSHAHTLEASAKLGLDLIQELPKTKVEEHYERYRLYFDNEYIDFSQAIALEYYFFTMHFGVLRAALKLPKTHNKLTVLMDRFPDSNVGEVTPGEPILPTQGVKFLNFIHRNSATAIGIEEENKKLNVTTSFGTLDWWKRNEADKYSKGKTHPHFILTDWLVAATIANTFRDDFIATFKREKEGVIAADGLEELYNTFKTFDIWSFDENVLPHLIASNAEWTVPEDAKEFILEIANG